MNTKIEAIIDRLVKAADEIEKTKDMSKARDYAEEAFEDAAWCLVGAVKDESA